MDVLSGGQAPRTLRDRSKYLRCCFSAASLGAFGAVAGGAADDIDPGARRSDVVTDGGAVASRYAAAPDGESIFALFRRGKSLKIMATMEQDPARHKQ